ncbi:MAG: hypothetical protein IJN50_05185 [Clostridia bacterium]|nr:hypothetical protein [Clostridia bacterium]
MKFWTGSSDYIILDVTDSEKNYSVGDEIAFNVNYSVLLRSMSTNFINKQYDKKEQI